MTAVRTFVIDLAEVTPESLSFGDIIDAAEAAEVEPDEMTALLANGTGRGAKKLRLLCAFAWIVARRTDPTIAFADVLAGRVEVRGTPDPQPPEPPPGELGL